MGNTALGSLTELQILNYAFIKNSLSIFSENGITADYFTTYRPQFEFLTSYYNQYGQLPSQETFQIKFDGKWDWLTVSDSADYLLKQLREAKLYRDVIVDYGKMTELIRDEKTDKAIEMMSEISQKYLQTSQSSCIDLITDGKARYDAYVESVNNPSKAFVTTGLPELDEILGGWDLQNESAAICARTGVGKSWMLVYFAMSAAKAGLRVGYYSGEMEADLIGYRFDTLLGNIANGSLTHGNASVKEQYENFIETLPTVVSGHLYCITPDDPMFGGRVTVDKLRSFIEKYDLQMLCVDQFSLVEDQRHAKTPREQAVNISKDLRALQRIKKIPILYAVQLNREDTTENGPSTKNISESDRIGQDCSTVLFIETKDDTMKMIIGKSRNAKSGDRLSYAWNKNMGIIRFIPTEGDARGGKDVDVTLEQFDTDKSDNVF